MIVWKEKNVIAIAAGAMLMTFVGSALAADTPFPPRFVVTTDNGNVFDCDLTVTHDASCTSHSPFAMTLARITIRRHAGDPSRVAVYGYGTQKTGLTWKNLQKGVVLGPTQMSNRQLGPVTVNAIAPSY